MKQFESIETQNVAAPQPRVSYDSLGLGQFALGIGFLFTVFMVTGMIVDQKSVTLAFLCGTLFLAFLVVLVVLSVSGQLAAIVINGQNERTKQEYNRMQYSLYMREPAQLEMGTLPQLEESPQQRNFIPARPQADERIKVSAYEFINNLYLDEVPDPERVLPKEHHSRPGQIQWTKPKKDVLEYLLALGVIREGEGRMLFLNFEYDTLRKAKLAIKHNIPVGRLK